MSDASAIQWLSTKDASERLGVTLRTLYRFIDEGRLPAYQVGRVIRLKAHQREEAQLAAVHEGEVVAADAGHRSARRRARLQPHSDRRPALGQSDEHRRQRRLVLGLTLRPMLAHSAVGRVLGPGLGRPP